jgi:hypothetical protein
LDEDYYERDSYQRQENNADDGHLEALRGFPPEPSRHDKGDDDYHHDIHFFTPQIAIIAPR